MIMADDIVYDEMLGELRTSDVSGGTSGGTSYVGGERINIAGETISFANSADIVNVTGTSVTIQPDTAYKIYATASAVTLNANPPAAGKWAYEGHLEIFVFGTGYVVTGSNVVLANALEPDAVNNCVVRFHDGVAIIDVEDHIAGYIVVSATGTADGSLPYGIDTSTNEYIAFDATLNGTTIDLSGSTANGEKHIVGNGYTETTLTGAVDCGTSKFTVANLSLQNVGITGGTMTLGDSYIPSGSIVTVNGGELAIEKCENNGAIQNVGSNFISIKNGALYGSGTVYLDKGNVRNINGTAAISGLVFSGGSSVNYGMQLLTSGGSAVTDVTGCTFSIGSSFGNRFGATTVIAKGTANYSRCLFTGNQTTGVAYAGCAAIAVLGDAATTANLLSCTVSGNTGSAVVLVGSGTLKASESVFDDAQTVNVLSGGTVTFAGSNVFKATLGNVYSAGTAGGNVVISSGAILDLTGNTNATPIAPGGGITFDAGGATVLYSSGAVSGSYMMDNVALPAGAKLKNTAVVNLGGTNVKISSGETASASGCAIAGGTAANGGAFYVSRGGKLTLKNSLISGNLTSSRGTIATEAADVKFINCVISGNTMGGGNIYDVYAMGGTVTFENTKVEKYVTLRNDAVAVITGTDNSFYRIQGFSGTQGNYGSVVISSGAVISLGDTINAQGGTTVEGTCTVNGHTIVENTYTSISSDGTTVPPQPESAEA